jgi:5S rRNA maturation endonuclease (ribonuclease M5)
VLTPAERLEELNEVLADLEDKSDTTPIVVEGTKDVEALRRLGITKNVHHLNRGESVFNFCEDLSRGSRRLIILTDWDRKGGMLARMLKEACHANEVSANLDIRAKLVILSKKEIKDIEGMPAFIERLRVRSALPGLPKRMKGVGGKVF